MMRGRDGGRSPYVLREGVVVTGKSDRDGNVRPWHGANRTQAEREQAIARAIGWTHARIWQPRCGPAFYVRIDDPQVQP